MASVLLRIKVVISLNNGIIHVWRQLVMWKFAGVSQNLSKPTQRIAGSGLEIENLAEVTNQPLRRQIQDGGQYEIYSLISSEN
jgi:hypothetical protein